MTHQDKHNLLSGSTVTGTLTLGNYIGAISQWQQMQDQFHCYFMVADLHALTVRQDPQELRTRTQSFYAQYLACGLDAQNNVIFLQSMVPEHAELMWILTCLTPMGFLNRMTQFKEKAALTREILAGLYLYPVLMAADILLYQTHRVPVGEDQKQHLELARDLVDFFHSRYGPTFVTPEPYIPPQGARIMSLQDPKAKMSKSDTNDKATVFILDEPKLIEKKLKSAVTDSDNKISYDPETKAGVSNLLTIYATLTRQSMEKTQAHFEGKMYGHLKTETADVIIETLKPVQEKYRHWMNEPAELNRLMQEGAQRAQAKAQETLKTVYERVGLIRFGSPNQGSFGRT